MARIRTIKPEYWTSEQVMNCTRDARLLFIGMWNFCDDGGNHPASAKTLKAEVFPGDDKLETSSVMTWVDELIEQGLVSEYEVDGKEFWHVTGWHHQRIDQPTLRHPAGDASDTASPKRLGGKQRQLLLKKLRERDGDACHHCGDTSNITLLRLSGESAENPHDASLYRLICTTCKRQNRTGDAQVTQGDARYVAGDSPPEGKVEESEGRGIPTPPTRAREDLSTGDRLVPEPPSPPVQQSRAVQIAVYLRANGIDGANSANPLIDAWAQNPSVTDELLETAIGMVRERKPRRPGPNYLQPIIAELLDPPPARESAGKRAEDWERDDNAAVRKGSELGLYMRTNERIETYRERIRIELRDRQQRAGAHR